MRTPTSVNQSRTRRSDLDVMPSPAFNRSPQMHNDSDLRYRNLANNLIANFRMSGSEDLDNLIDKLGRPDSEVFKRPLPVGPLKRKGTLAPGVQNEQSAK